MILFTPITPDLFTGQRRADAEKAIRLFQRNTADEQDYCLSAHKCRLDGDTKGFKEYSLRAKFALWAAERQLAILMDLAGEKV